MHACSENAITTFCLAVRLVRIVQIPHLVPELLRVHCNEFVQLEHIIQARVIMDQSAMSMNY